MKIVSIVGARPQFIKSVPVSQELTKNNISEVMVHTGQHFDQNMSDIFFDQLKIPKPHYLLNINCLNHGAMTGQMLQKIEEVLLAEKPEYVIVYGDTNSTLAGALAASKLNIKIIHIEAGLRSFNMLMPEEINRIVTDRLSYFLFCPTKLAVDNLRKEGFENFNCNIIHTGDVMFDSALMFLRYAIKPKYELPDNFILCTIHRQENTDEKVHLKSILEALNSVSDKIKIILPIHPRTQKKIKEFKLSARISKNIYITDPVGYLEMIYLIKHSSLIMTDSGGLQKEAFFFNKFCITLREETEWIELVENGYNIIAGSDYKTILDSYNQMISRKIDFNMNLYGEGKASCKIVKNILNEHTTN